MGVSLTVQGIGFHVDGPGLKEAQSRSVGAGVDNVCLIPLEGLCSRVRGLC